MHFPHEFVCATYERTSFERHIPAPLFRKPFTVDTVDPKAEILIGSPGFYDLWINGRKITKGYLAPYIANPDDLVYFDRYEVGEYLQEGENVVAVMLGDGFQNMIDSVWDFDHARHNGSPRFALNYTSEGLSFAAPDFVCSDSEMTFNSYRCGVHVDARLEQTGWAAPGFDAGDWREVLAAEEPRGEYRICEAEPIRVTEEIPALAITRGNLISGLPRPDVVESFQDAAIIPVPIEAEGGFIYDFGVNTAGIFRLTIDAEAGQRIVLQVAERLKGEDADPTNISFFYPEGYGQRDVYIAKGEGTEVFEPAFTYHGGRYIYVSGITESQATPELLTFLQLHSDLPRQATLETSDETVNRLWEITLRSDLTNFHYFLTDCPHREKNGWTGDVSMSAEHLIFTLGAERSFTEWMRSVTRAQDAQGALPGIVPTTSWGFDWGNGPAWDSALFTVPYFTYIYRGETQIIEESAQAMLKYLDYVSTRRDARGIVEFGLGDWCPVGRGPDDYLVPLGFTDSVMVLDMCQKAAVMFAAIDRPLSVQLAETLGQELREAIRRTYLDPSTMLITGDTQSGQAMGLYYGVFDSSERKQALDQLVRLIEQADKSMNVGFLGGRVIFHVLAEFGQSDLAHHMITKKDYPSYGHLLERGATTLWEMFLPEPQLSGSENHHFWGDINHWFLRHLVGIHVNPGRNDANRILVKPQFVGALDEVKGSYLAPAGEITVAWTRASDGVIELTVDAADGIDWSLELAAGWYFEDDQRSYRAADSRTHRIVNRR